MILHVSEMEIMKSWKIVRRFRARDGSEAKHRERENQQTTARQNKYTKIEKKFHLK